MTKISCWPFWGSSSWTICQHFLPTFLIFYLFPTFLFSTSFGIFGHFVDLFGLVSPVMSAKVPFCTKNSAALMLLVQRKSYYARHAPKFLVQSCYHAAHIWQNVYFSSLDYGLLINSGWTHWYLCRFATPKKCPGILLGALLLVGSVQTKDACQWWIKP